MRVRRGRVGSTEIKRAIVRTGAVVCASIASAVLCTVLISAQSATALANALLSAIVSMARDSAFKPITVLCTPLRCAHGTASVTIAALCALIGGTANVAL